MGCADRSAYDLTVHSKQTDKPLLVRQKLDTPRTVSEWEITLERKKFGPFFKKDGRAVETVILSSTQECREKWAKELQDSGKATVEVPGLGKVDVSEDMIRVEYRSRTEHIRDYTPQRHRALLRYRTYSLCPL